MERQLGGLEEEYLSKADGYYEYARTEMLEFIPRDCSFILDVGCSSGGFGAALKEDRPQTIVWGIEPNQNACEIASERLDKVICGTFAKDIPELIGKKVDCIIFNDVLEHLANPGEALDTAKSYLDREGILVASIPNVLHFYNIWKILREQDWRYEDSGIMDNTHLRFFTKKSILRMFESAGFHVLRIQGINKSYGLKFQIANLLSFGSISDWKFVQFAIAVRMARENDDV